MEASSLSNLSLAVGLLAPVLGASPAAVQGQVNDDPERTAEVRLADRQVTLPAELAGVLSAFDRIAGRELWPGFEPEDVPFAVYDGESTWLLRHPSPPAGFRPVRDEENVRVYPGRHPSVWANMPTVLGDVETAVVLLEGRLDQPPAELAGLLLHEAFHVFERKSHPTWSANEVTQLTYPVTDSTVLGLRRLESRYLYAALQAGTPDERRARARSALAVRTERFARMPADAVTYERKTELNEGLARYVEGRAVGDPTRSVFETTAFPAEEVRERAYASGQALALLLDDVLPTWKERLASDTALSLDALLGDALFGRRPPPSEARPRAHERRSALSRAGKDVRELEGERQARLTEFLEQPGWSVEFLAAEGMPLWPQRFDPLNVLKIDEDRVLHTRWLVLGNEAGRVEVMDHAALSRAAAAHPLFEGVASLLITGLPEPPDVTADGEAVRLEAPSLEAEIRGGIVERSEGKIVVRLEP